MKTKEKFLVLKGLGHFYDFSKEPPKTEAKKLILAEMADEELAVKVENGFIYFQHYENDFIKPTATN